MAKAKEKEKQQKHYPFEPFHIKVTVEGIGLEIDVKAHDPCDCVNLAGAIINYLKINDIEAKVFIY